MRQPILHFLNQCAVHRYVPRERASWSTLLAAGFLICLGVVGTEALTAATRHLQQGSASSHVIEKTVREQSSKKAAKILATLTASTYEVNVYWALPYVPSAAGKTLLQPEPGYRYVILDVALSNTSAKPVDIGDVLSTATLLDEQRRQYVSEPLGIAAFQQDYPYPNHHSQYKAMRGKLQPGAVYRTTFFAFQVPFTANRFMLQMQDDINKTQWHNAAFSVQQPN